jgi:uncharacterized protein
MGINKQMQNFVVSLLQNKLPAHYTYHNVEHTLYVTEKAEEIARNENCTEEEITLLCAAALWHDAGCIITFKGHEEESCKMAKQYLPDYLFSAADIELVCGIIMATKIPQSPKTKLEEILADADLEYLGTENATAFAENLYRELLHLHPFLTKNQWNHNQISFLQKHNYFTGYCKEQKEPGKKEYMQTLMNTTH